MSAVFDIKEHVIESQHIREYPRATAHSQEEVLHIAIKQYIPKDNPNPQPGDVTVIGAHANGFVKELYEPLWEDLLTEARRKGFNIRSIWIADVAAQGDSGVLNEHELGNDPSWLDHARDLLHMTNVFRAEMPRPLIGIGHSFGANVIVNLALMHPRLLSSLVLLDPVLSRFEAQGPWYGFGYMKASAGRRDLWPSRGAAAEAVMRNRVYAAWDPRAVTALVTHGFRDTPTALYPGEQGKTTIKTTKHHEVFTYYRPVAARDPRTGRLRPLPRSEAPDADPAELARYPDYPFYRPEGPLTTDRLPHLRPPVLWVFGETSGVCAPDQRREKMELTGVGVGGSGGAAAGMVREVTVKGCGHLVAMEAPGQVARHAADFVAPALGRWRAEQAEYQAWVTGRDDRAKQTLDEEWVANIAAVQWPPPKAKL
ncbi:Peroxisomal membrane protein LPX1 [Pleurostoma richardsiae]|uniref:Peroxisomal membrane protein LPX1 n=1 Tax=Pleurostoma richardsiae TaxID=41990 RepID=A0AA38VHI9_9PEZI|nr:Peroxisomal membrane protein LPX1 [Pleurostoma richardsiae]